MANNWQPMLLCYIVIPIWLKSVIRNEMSVMCVCSEWLTKLCARHVHVELAWLGEVVCLFKEFIVASFPEDEEHTISVIRLNFSERKLLEY